MSLLEVDDLSVRFRTDDGPVQAVDRVSFSVAERIPGVEFLRTEASKDPEGCIAWCYFREVCDRTASSEAARASVGS